MPTTQVRSPQHRQPRANREVACCVNLCGAAYVRSVRECSGRGQPGQVDRQRNEQEALIARGTCFDTTTIRFGCCTLVQTVYLVLGISCACCCFCTERILMSSDSTLVLT